MKWETGQCATGDIISVKIGAVYHYGIFVSESEVIQFGMPPVGAIIRDSSSIQVLATDIDVFSAGNFVEAGIAE